MKKLYCVIYGKYRISEKLKILYVFRKTLVFSIVCVKYKNEDEKIFKEEESIFWFNWNNIITLEIWQKKT